MHALHTFHNASSMPGRTRIEQRVSMHASAKVQFFFFRVFFLAEGAVYLTQKIDFGGHPQKCNPMINTTPKDTASHNKEIPTILVKESRHSVFFSAEKCCLYGSTRLSQFSHSSCRERITINTHRSDRS